MSFLRKVVGSHYAIERFGILFLTLMFCMGLLVSSIFGKQVEYNNKALSGNAIYTRSFTMSQTKSTGSVIGVYTNKDRTKCFVLLQFQDMSMLPIDANEYTMFLTGSSKSGVNEELKSTPSGMFYLFGSTGYAGIYLQDINGFPSQIVNLYLRATSNFTGSTASGYSDKTFENYNQASIYFNPGGLYATHADFLEGQWSVFDMVEEIMTRSREKSIRTQLRSDLYEMAKQQLLIQEYKTRLDSYGVVIPELPESVDDEIYAISSKDSTKSRLHYISEYGGGWVSDDGKVAEKSVENLVFYLDSDYVLPKGYDFNWQDGRILTGYLEYLSGYSDLQHWLSYMYEVANDSRKDTFLDTMSRMSWVMTDGSVAPTLIGNAAANYSQREKEISTTIDAFKTALTQYHTLKEQYELTDLNSLLQLELDGRTSLDSYTVNTGEKGPVLTIW